MNTWPHLSVPVMNDEFTRHPQAYVQALHECGADVVFLASRRCFDRAALQADFDHMAVNIALLQGEGFQVGCWIQAFGFGNPLSAADEAHAHYRRIMDMGGRVCGDAFCPTDEAYTAFVADQVRMACRAGAKIVMLDDDLCLNIRPGLGCACDEHMALFSRRMGRPVSRAELRQMIYDETPNASRQAWLGLMGDTLTTFCAAMRAAADQVNPVVRLGFCAGYTSFDMEGADALQLAQVLAGKHRPFLRLSGAPYWVPMHRFAGQSMAHVVEFARMQAAWCERAGVDYFAENDSYPRPRYRVAAAYVECFDFCMAASGVRHQLKYVMDYFSAPDYETGYIAAHLKHRDLINDVFSAAAPLRDAGVYVHEDMRKLAHMNLEPDMADSDIMRAAAFSASADLLSGLGISTSYVQQGGMAAAFGQAGATVPLSGFRGYILDHQSAVALSQRGVDVGLISSERVAVPRFEHFAGFNDRVELNWLDTTARSTFYKCAIADTAQVESTFLGDDGPMPASYAYENASGQRFLVFAFRADTLLHGGSVFMSYYRQAQILAFCEQCGAPLPAWTRKYPGLYTICRAGEGRLFVGLCNFSLDDIDQPVIHLTGDWRSARFMGCHGTLHGRELRLSPLMPYGFAAVLLTC